MPNKKGLKKIKKITQNFFKKMAFEVDFETLQREENTLVLELKTPEPQILIGEKGKTLSDIQKILGKILRKQLGEEISPVKSRKAGIPPQAELFNRVYLDLDINQYKKNKAKHLKEVAQELADKVALERKERILFPMTPYERRIVHLELAKRGDIKTESIGEEPERRVVIKPA